MGRLRGWHLSGHQGLWFRMFELSKHRSDQVKHLEGVGVCECMSGEPMLSFSELWGIPFQGCKRRRTKSSSARSQIIEYSSRIQPRSGQKGQREPLDVDFPPRQAFCGAAEIRGETNRNNHFFSLCGPWMKIVETGNPGACPG